MRYIAFKICKFQLGRKILNAGYNENTDCIFEKYYCNVCDGVVINSDKADRSKSEHMKEYYKTEIK